MILGGAEGQEEFTIIGMALIWKEDRNQAQS